MKNIAQLEKAIFGLVVTFIVALIISQANRWSSTGYLMMAMYLTHIILPVIYLFRTKFSHLFVCFICFALYYLGTLFRMCHWPLGGIMLIIGEFAYFSSGILLLSTNRNIYNEVEKAIITIVSILSIFYFVDLVFKISPVLFLRLIHFIIMFLSLIFLYKSKVEEQGVKQIFKIYLLYSVLPVTLLIISLI